MLLESKRIEAPKVSCSCALEVALIDAGTATASTGSRESLDTSVISEFHLIWAVGGGVVVVETPWSDLSTGADCDGLAASHCLISGHSSSMV